MKIFSIIALSLLIASCAAKQEALPQKEVNYFGERKGCFLLYNMKTGTFDKVLGEETCKEQFPACSTFKVPLAVMAFDSGIVKDENAMWKWNGVKDPYRQEPNKDHNAKTWMKESIVWYSQRITQKMGKAKLQKYLNDFDYGNKDLTGGLTQAWLVSPGPKPALKISSYQQVDFMKKLWTDALPASKRAQKIARELTFLEESPQGFALSGKTGSGFYDKARKVNLGWFISHVQKDNQEYIAVTNVSDLAPVQEKVYGGLVAKEITKKILADQGLW